MERSSENIENLYATILAELNSAKEQDSVSKWDAMARVNDILCAIGVSRS